MNQPQTDVDYRTWMAMKACDVCRTDPVDAIFVCSYHAGFDDALKRYAGRCGKEYQTEDNTVYCLNDKGHSGAHQNGAFGREWA